MMEYKKQLEFLGQKEGNFTEFRILFEDGSMRPEFRTNLSPKKDIEAYLIDKVRQVYVGINPRRSCSGRAQDVSSLNCLVLDIDPVRPRGEGSTEKQHKASIALAEKILDDLIKHKKGIKVAVVDSGSGAHVYIPIVPILVTDYQVLTASIRRWFYKIKKHYETAELRIDPIYDISRIIRVWGSWNTKSNRPCKLHKMVGDKLWDKTFSQQAGKLEPLPVSAVLDVKFNKLIKTSSLIASCMGKTRTYSSRSESDYAFVSELLKCGFSADEIKVLAKKNPLGRMEEMKAGDVERIISKQVNNGIKTKFLATYSTKYIESLHNRTRGISTGFNGLDGIMGGLRGKELTIISGRPSAGKTSFICFPQS